LCSYLTYIDCTTLSDIGTCRGSIFSLHWFHISSYSILRHSSIVYPFVSMIIFCMDPFCIFSWPWLLLLYISHGSNVYSFLGHGHQLGFYTPWICSVLDLVVMLLSLLSMVMPKSGREYSYLISSYSYVVGSIVWELSLELIQCILSS